MVRQFHERFVTKLEWIDEPMVSGIPMATVLLLRASPKYQQIFAISQALPGSASTKMLFCINNIRSGFTGGAIAFLLFW